MKGVLVMKNVLENTFPESFCIDSTLSDTISLKSNPVEMEVFLNCFELRTLREILQISTRHP